MKRLKIDREARLIRLEIETLDDLWHLRNLIQEGDLVTMDTYRTAETPADKLRSEKAEKKRMRLGVRVEQVDWHEFDDHLRVLGTIEAGPQDHGRHHTHIVRDDNSRIDIQKQKAITKWMLDTVDEAVAQSKEAQVVLLAIDDAEAQFALLRRYGVQWLGSLPGGGQGKRHDGAAAAKQAFYDEALKTLKQLRNKPDVGVVVVGPGWWREEFIDHVEKRDPQLAKGILTDGTSQGGRNGVQEALRRGIVERVARDHRVQWETQQVEEVFTRIATEGAVAYGPQEVRTAVEAGAAEAVLVSDDIIRSGNQDALLAAADRTRCEVHIVGTSHDAGIRLSQLGGVAALLRFHV